MVQATGNLRRTILLAIFVVVTISLFFIPKRNLACTYIVLEEDSFTIEDCYFRKLRPLNILGETHFSTGTGSIEKTVYNNGMIIGNVDYPNLGTGEGIIECPIDTDMVDKGDELEIVIDLYRNGHVIDSQTIQVTYN